MVNSFSLTEIESKFTKKNSYIDRLQSVLEHHKDQFAGHYLPYRLLRNQFLQGLTDIMIKAHINEGRNQDHFFLTQNMN